MAIRTQHLVFSSPLALTAIRLIVFTLLLINSFIIHAFEVNNESNNFTLTPEVYWLEDPSQLLTINEIDTPSTLKQFNKNEFPLLYFGYSQSSIWLYIRLSHQNVSPVENRPKQNWFLSIESPQLDLIEIYEKMPSGKLNTYLLGDHKPFKHRSIKSRHFIQALQFQDEDYIDLFIKVESSSSLNIPIYLYNDIGLIEKHNNESTFHGIYFGIVIAMLIYSALTYIMLRKKIYLHFIGYTLTYSLLLATMAGYSSQFFWPHQPEINQRAIFFLSGLSCFFSFTLSKKFLRFKKQKKLFNKLLNIGEKSSFILAITALLINHGVIANAALIITVFTGLTITTLTLYNSLQGNNSAKILLCSWLFLPFWPLFFALSFKSSLPTGINIETIILISSSINIILMALSLAYRHNERKNWHLSLSKISEKNLEKSKKELLKSLSIKDQSIHIRDQFLTTISHELRTPMNGIEGSLALIETRNLDKKQLNYVNAAIKSAKKMTSLIEAILSFSEIQSGTFSVQSENIEIRPFFHTLAEEYRYLCKINNIEFNLHIDKQVPPFITSNKDELSLVVYQLIDNAIKFTHEGHISINLSTTSSRQKLAISVTDTGKGISKDNIRSIFSNFEQMDTRSNHYNKGLGIGLTICYRLSILMKGSLDIESTLNKGSHFTFTIPLVTPSPLTSDQMEYSQNNIEQKVALVAEDNPVNQMVLKGMLENLGCIVLTAVDGQKTLDILEQQPVDIVLMDCQMPNIDGFEATKIIRASRKNYSNLPIIAVTANALTSDSSHCLAAGMNDYIKKPVSSHILELKLNQWLSQTPIA